MKGDTRKRVAKGARDGKLYGRTNSRSKENVAVYCDEEGSTCVSIWTIFRRQSTLRMSLNAARVLRKALDDYLTVA